MLGRHHEPGCGVLLIFGYYTLQYFLTFLTIAGAGVMTTSRGFLRGSEARGSWGLAGDQEGTPCNAGVRPDSNGVRQPGEGGAAWLLGIHFCIFGSDLRFGAALLCLDTLDQQYRLETTWIRGTLGGSDAWERSDGTGTV